MTNDDSDTSADVSSTLRTALRDRPSPPPTWNLDHIKARGRRRRLRTRALPVALGLAVVATVGGVGAAGGMSWLWTATTTTTVAAPDASGSPEQVVRGYIEARMAGDDAAAHNDYWVQDPTWLIRWNADKLRVNDVRIGVPRSYPTTDTVTQGWRQAVAVPLSYSYDDDPALVIGKAPFSGSVILVRNDDTDAWRIVRSDEWPSYSVPAIVPATPDPVIAIAGHPEGLVREAWARTGTVGLEDGCLVMDEALLVWPQGSAWDDATEQIVLTDGTRLGIGDRIETWGAPLGDLTGFLDQAGEAAINSCGGVDAEAAAAGRGRPVLEVSTA
ncbi:hypothetical protein GTR02_03935 [Kineococcus sp. R8]|uniref:hypothetical protein n=1 Tax=Kineococcus siccus TaxID=2696567 RepID=UPI0014125644|nr:hypothetical protein [Kineococcus siccus]NAZ80964.1 hypothetical protein [Kineococcus siccus]